MKKKSISIKSFDNAKWEEYQPIRVNTRDKDGLYVSFYKSPKKDLVNKVHIKIGEGIITKLGWNKKTKVGFFNDADDLMQIMLCERERGYSLSNITGSPQHMMSITWNDKRISLREMKSTPQEYVINKGRLFFKIKDAA